MLLLAGFKRNLLELSSFSLLNLITTSESLVFVTLKVKFLKIMFVLAAPKIINFSFTLIYSKLVLILLSQAIVGELLSQPNQNTGRWHLNIINMVVASSIVASSILALTHQVPSPVIGVTDMKHGFK